MRFALWMLLALPVQDDPRALVEQLRSDFVVERDAAAKKLLALGEAARGALEAAAKDPDAEVAGRAGRILRVLEIRSKIPPRLKAAVPGIEERLASDHDRAWTDAFFAALGDRNSRRLPSSIEREDLDFLVARALRGAAGEAEQARICQSAGDHDLRSAIPGLVRLLSVPSSRIGHTVKRALIELDAREAWPQLLELLGGPDTNGSTYALSVLRELEVKEAVPGLVERLRSDLPYVRANAAACLEKVATPEVAPALLPLLRDKWDPACRAAARALGVLGAKEAVADLRALLEERERDVRGTAASALGRLGAKEAVPDLLKALEDPGKHDARDEFARALGDLGAKEAVPALVRLLDDKGFQSKEEILPVVVRLVGAAASPHVVAGLSHADADVRLAAVAAARTLKIRGLAPALAPLLEEASNDLLHQLSEAIVETGAKEIAPQLLKLASNDNAREPVRRSAILLLGRAGGADAVGFLRERLRDGKEPEEVRLCAAHALADLGAKEAIPDLLPLFGLKEEDVQRAAVIAAGRLGARETVPALLALVEAKDGRTEAQAAAARALAGMGAKEAVPLLRKALEGDDFPGPAALALAELGDREAVPGILRILLVETGEDELREAADAMARLDPAAGAAGLRERLRSERREDRSAAAVALCRMGFREGVPVLLAAARADTRLSLCSLNAVRSPAAWKELRERTRAWVMPGGSISSELLVRLVSGVEVEPEEDGSSTWVMGNDIDQGWGPALHALEEYEECFILEKDRVRTLERHRALRFWEAWWQEEEKGK